MHNVMDAYKISGVSFISMFWKNKIMHQLQHKDDVEFKGECGDQ